MWGAIWSKVLIMKKGSQNGKGTLSTSDRTGHLRDITPGKVSTHPQGEGHSEDATDGDGDRNTMSLFWW